MKKSWKLIAIVVLTICMVGYAFDRIVPANIVNASSETHREFNSAGPSEKEVLIHTSSEQPVVFIVTGLVCALFGTIAVAPLLLEKPTQ